MKRFVILILFAMGIFALRVFQPGDNLGNASLLQSSGSTLQNRRSLPESGSRLSPRVTRRGAQEAGSSYRFGSRNSESGSSLRRNLSGRESGSQLRNRNDKQESGSLLGKAPGSRSRDRGPRDFPAPQAGREYAVTGAPASAAQLENASLILIALLILLIGGAGGYFLFRGALGITPNRELWSKQVELCCEIMQQMDAIITETQAADWDRCRDSIESLRELSGRRTILLINDINRAAIVFLAAATHCVQREECTNHFDDMRLSFHTAINAMRTIANSEPMTDDVHRLLDASHQQMRVIHSKESGAA